MRSVCLVTSPAKRFLDPPSPGHLAVVVWRYEPIFLVPDPARSESRLHPRAIVSCMHLPIHDVVRVRVVINTCYSCSG